MIIKPDIKEQRTETQLREHYEVEKKLADRLRNATRDERRFLYTFLYDELYRLIPHHRQLTRKESPEKRQENVQNQMKFLKRFFDENKSFLEVGPGDCALAFHAANIVKKVYAVDVSHKITEASSIPDNFSLIISDGSSIPVPMNSIDIVYSNQLMEHLHPDDARDQLSNIFKALVPGGLYLCITPNRLNGPHDISMYFDSIATGFHLKEYTFTELTTMFKSVGFKKVLIYMNIMGKYIRFPIFPAILCERVLERFPQKLRLILVNMKLIKRLIKIRLVGVKKR